MTQPPVFDISGSGSFSYSNSYFKTYYFYRNRFEIIEVTVLLEITKPNYDATVMSDVDPDQKQLPLIVNLKANSVN